MPFLLRMALPEIAGVLDALACHACLVHLPCTGVAGHSTARVAKSKALRRAMPLAAAATGRLGLSTAFWAWQETSTNPSDVMAKFDRALCGRLSSHVGDSESRLSAIRNRKPDASSRIRGGLFEVARI